MKLSNPVKMIPAPPVWLMMAEGRALIESTALVPLLPLIRQVPRGDGHPVLVLPGFLATSRSTWLLRHFLRDRGYAAHRWKLGRNRGYRPALEKGMEARVGELADRYGRRVSLIGWSLGGIYARELARNMADHVRQVITMGSPFAAGGHGTNVRWLYELIAQHPPEAIDQDWIHRMRQPPPVPTTAIFSRTDGIASWRVTIEEIGHAQVENVEVGGAHIGLGFNPRALLVVGDRLAQPEGQWQPFAPRGLWRLMFGEIQNVHTHGDPPPLQATIWKLEQTLNALQQGLGGTAVDQLPQIYQGEGSESRTRL